MGQNSIVSFSGTTFSYVPNKVLFEGLSYDFEHGLFYTIGGPSGIGKSTLLRLINRLEEPQAGDISFNGISVRSYPPPALRRSILYIQQTPTAIDGSVRDNLLLPFTFRSNRQRLKPNDEDLRKYLDTLLLEGVRLEDNALNLSVGQLQRLCLIRGLLLSPEILLLDEPTSALDKESRSIVESMAERQCLESKRTVIMASHRTFSPRLLKPVALTIENGILEEHR
jgi:putative ABC transport system ATP-binding protein